MSMIKPKSIVSRVGVVASVVALSLIGQVLVPTNRDGSTNKSQGILGAGVAESTELAFDPENSVLVEELTSPTQVVFEDPRGS